MSQSIPLLLAIEFLQHHDDDRIVHLVRSGVVGMAEPLTVEIESEFYQWPHILNLWTDGDFALPPRLRDLFIIKCYQVLLPTLEFSDIGEIYIPDATAWVEIHFLTSEAEILLQELRRHVPPGWRDGGGTRAIRQSTFRLREETPTKWLPQQP